MCVNLDNFKEPADLLKRENLLEICQARGSERAELIAQAELKASEFKVKTALKRLINEMLAEEQAEEIRRAAIAESYDLNGVKIKRDGNGKPITSIENFVEILRRDEFSTILSLICLRIRQNGTEKNGMTPATVP